MAKANSSLVFLYSGGADNTSAASSLGGMASSAPGGRVASQTYTASTIPGIAITHAARNPVGDGTLGYSASSKTITWLPHLGSPAAVVALASGNVAIGSTTSGFIVLYISYGSLPVADATQSIAIADSMGTVFDTPPAGDLISGATEYRCLYLKNESIQEAISISMALTEDAAESTIRIGSLLDPISRYATSAAEMDALRYVNFLHGAPPVVKCFDALAPRESLGILHTNGLPYFPYFPTDTIQDSDGSTEDVSPAIVTKYDPSNILAQVKWGTTLYWPYIHSGRMVSFWLQRVLPPNPTVPVIESLSLDLLLTLQ